MKPFCVMAVMNTTVRNRLLEIILSFAARDVLCLLNQVSEHGLNSYLKAGKLISPSLAHGDLVRANELKRS